MVDPPPEAYYDAVEDTVFVEGDSGDGISVTVINNNEIILDQYYHDLRYLRHYRWYDDYYWDPYYYDYRHHYYRPHWHSGGYHRGGAVARPKKPRRRTSLRRPIPSDDPSPSGGSAPTSDKKNVRRTDDSGDKPSSTPSEKKKSDSGDKIKANQSEERKADIREKKQEKSPRKARRISSDPRHEKVEQSKEEKKSPQDSDRKPADKE